MQGLQRQGETAAINPHAVVAALKRHGGVQFFKKSLKIHLTWLSKTRGIIKKSMSRKVGKYFLRAPQTFVIRRLGGSSTAQ